MPVISVLAHSSKIHLSINCSEKMEVSCLIFIFSIASREDVNFVTRGHYRDFIGERVFLLVPVCLLSSPLRHEWLLTYPPSTTGMASHVPCSRRTCSVPSLQLLRHWLLYCPVSLAQVISPVPRNSLNGCFIQSPEPEGMMANTNHQ